MDTGEIRFNAGTGNKITGNSTYKTDVTNCDFRSSTNEFSLDASKITTANQLDYRKVIVPRAFDKDWRPKDPRRVLPRMRNVAAFANR